MPAAVRSVSTLGFAVRTNSTYTAPSGIQDGDYLVLMTSVGNTGDGLNAVTLAGFSELASGYGYKGVDDFSVGQKVLAKVASGESGDYTFTHASAGTNGILYCLSGIDTGNPTLTGPTVETGTGASVSVADVNGVSAAAGDILLYGVGAWDTAGPASPPAETPPTLSERYDPGAANNFYAADGVLGTGGTLTTYTQTITNGVGNPWAAIALALRGAAAVGAFPPIPPGSIGSPALLIWDQAGVF